MNASFVARPQLDLVDVDPERRAAVALDEAMTRRRLWERSNRQPRRLSATEALQAVQFECLVIWCAGASLLHDARLPDDERERVTLAMQRIDAICGEAT